LNAAEATVDARLKEIKPYFASAISGC